MDLPNILSKTNNNNNNSDGRILDADTEWRDRSEAEAGTPAYNDDEAFHFLIHELFPEQRKTKQKNGDIIVRIPESTCNPSTPTNDGNCARTMMTIYTYN